MLVTNDSDSSELHHASEHLGSNIGTAGVVTEIFGEQFFAPVRSRDACLDRYLRNWESPIRIIRIILCAEGSCASDLLYPGRVGSNGRKRSGSIFAMPCGNKPAMKVFTNLLLNSSRGVASVFVGPLVAMTVTPPDLGPASSPANPLILRQSALVRFCRRDVDLDFILAAHLTVSNREYKIFHKSCRIQQMRDLLPRFAGVLSAVALRVCAWLVLHGRLKA